MKVIVAGGGIGGLTAAIALRQAGHEVTVHERAPAMGWGQGVQLSPPGMAVLAELGLADEAQRIGQVMREARKLTHDGLLLRDRSLGQVADLDQPHVSISRGALQVMLCEAAKASGAEVRLQESLASFAQEAGSVTATFALEEEKHCAVEGDLLIGADGIHSQARRSLFPDAEPIYTGFVQYRGVIPVDAVAVDVEPGVVTVYGHDRKFYTYYLMNETEISFGACVDVGEDAKPEDSWSAKGDPEEMIACFEGFDGPLPALAHATPFLARMHIFDHATLPAWSDGRVTLLGDAAHAILPFAGQATVTAIEDAVALVGELGGEGSVEEALRRYERLRSPQAARIREHCRRRGGIFEEYLVAASLEGEDWGSLSREERQAWLGAIDWSSHDSFLRDLY